MRKTPFYTYLFRPKLLLWLLVLLLLLVTLWQGIRLAQLGPAWQSLPQRIQATPLVDYAEQEAVRVLLADDSMQAQRLVSELAATKLISSAQLYGEEGQLIASAAKNDPKLSGLSEAQEPDEALALKDEPTSPPQLSEAPLKLGKSNSLSYVRPLYQAEQPIGFLRLQLAHNPLSLAQQGIWRQMEHHLSWLLPLCLSLGLLLGMSIQHLRQRHFSSKK
ncbi:hypothetical protein [Oceanisphaera avium]|nr:hypothetical protein [Oceanisphaera avium]